MLKGWWIGNIKGQKRLIKRIKVLKTQGSSDVHTELKTELSNYVLYNVYNLVCAAGPMLWF